jgi:hypothetical protein
VFSIWRDSLYKVPASGGTAELYLSVDPATEVDFHRISALPDNRIIIMNHLRSAPASYRAEIFDGKKRIVLVKNDAGLGSFAPTHGLGLIYAPPGYLLFSRYDANPGVWAVPFSTDPVDLSKAVLVEAGSDVVDAADDGTLLTESIPTQNTMFRLAWLDRGGRVSEIPAQVEFEDSSGAVATTQGMAFALSPDSHLVTFASASPRDIFIRDLSTSVDTRLTFDGIAKGNPSWFPSGRRVLYSVRTLPELSKMFWRDVDGTGDAHEVGAGSNGRISPDGRYIVYLLDDRGRARIRYAEILPDSTFGPPQNVFSSVDEPNVSSFDLSTDGRFIAYTSVGVRTEPEIFLTQFPTGKGRWQVTSGESATLPRFSHDGRELFYVSGSAPGKLIAVPIALQPAVKLGPASVVIDMTKKEANGLTAARGYDVSRDWKRFLLSRSLPSGGNEDARLVVLQNWLAAIKK